jgi:hypothetical protein
MGKENLIARAARCAGSRHGVVHMDAILSRRSIREYTREPISEKLVKELLEAAMSACVSMCH